MSDAVYRSAAAAADVASHYRRVLAHWPVPREELTVPTRVGPTFVVASGTEDAPPVVLLHGAMANAGAWLPDVGVWSSKFRVFAVDMIGEPGFSARIRPDLTSDAHALWLDDVFDALGLGADRRPIALVGTSLGGWLALDYACRRGTSVRALALLAPAGIGGQKNFLLRAFPLLLLGAWGRRKMMELVFGPERESRPKALELLGPMIRSIRRAAKPRVVRIPRLTDNQLAALRMPILAIVGGRDVLLDSRSTAARLRASAPHAQVRFIEDGYHLLPNETQHVMDFLVSCQ